MSAIPLVSGSGPAETPPVASDRAQPRSAHGWYRHPALVAGIVITGVIVIMAIAAPLLSSYNPVAQNLGLLLCGFALRR